MSTPTTTTHISSTVPAYIQLKKPVLCVDYGWDAIRFALIPECPTLQDLQGVKITVMQHDPKEFESLLSPDGPLAFLSSSTVESVAFSFCGPVSDDRKTFLNLYKKTTTPFPAKVGTTVMGANDGTCSMVGADFLLRLLNKEPKYPFLSLALGNAVGVGIGFFPDNSYTSFEISEASIPYKNLEESERLATPSQQPHPHNVLGSTVFQNYVKHVSATIEDLNAYLQSAEGIHIKDCVIGGENSVVLPEGPATLLGPKQLRDLNLDPNILPLLGAAVLSNNPEFPTATLPSFDTLVQKYTQN